MSWNLSEAKNRLSEVLTRAATEGPQTICRRGESFILLRESEYERLNGSTPKRRMDARAAEETWPFRSDLLGDFPDSEKADLVAAWQHYRRDTGEIEAVIAAQSAED